MGLERRFPHRARSSGLRASVRFLLCIFVEYDLRGHLIHQGGCLADEILSIEIRASQPPFSGIHVKGISCVHNAQVVKDDARTTVHLLLNHVLRLLENRGEGLARRDEVYKLIVSEV